MRPDDRRLGLSEPDQPRRSWPRAKTGTSSTVNLLRVLMVLAIWLRIPVM